MAAVNAPVVLGLTLGDPAGIGPEVAIKAALGGRWPRNIRLVLVGAEATIRTTCRQLGYPPVPTAGCLEPCRELPRVSCWDPAKRAARVGTVVPGRCTAYGASLAVGWIKAAVAACRGGRLHGIVTGPINKEGLRKAGVPHPGHTEMLADLTHTRRFAMLLVGGPLRVVLVTRHVPLSRVAAALTPGMIVETATLMAEGLPWLGAPAGRVGVCALNPHGGDGGVLGDEERRVIAPALRVLKRRGIPVEGPVPADVVFHQAVHGRYAAVVAMYHDQGLAPLKMLAFESGVNVTLGLPIVRTSPDHGTAYDIAGKGIANPESMVEAIRLAASLARRPNPWRADRRGP